MATKRQKGAERAARLLPSLLAFLSLCAPAFGGDAQERLAKEASAQLISLNDEMLKALNLKPEELDGKKLYVKAQALERPDGSCELKVESLSVGEPKRELQAPGSSVYLKCTVKPQADRTWKLSIDDVLPKEPAKGPAAPDKTTSTKESAEKK